MGIIERLFGSTKKIGDGKVQQHEEQINSIQQELEELNIKTKIITKELIKIADSRNVCINTSLRYNPEYINNLKHSIKIRNLSGGSNYNFIATLTLDRYKNEEIVLAQFNNRNLKEVFEKIYEQLKFQEDLKNGELSEEDQKRKYRNLEEYAEENEIEITPEGKQIFTNTSADPINIIKSVIYMGDNEIIDANIIEKLTGYEAWRDLDMYSIDEIYDITEGEDVTKTVNNINQIMDIEGATQYKEEIEAFMDRKEIEQDELGKNYKTEYNEIIKKLKEMNALIEANKYFVEHVPNYKQTPYYAYFRLLCSGEEQKAEDYYKRQKLDLGSIAITIEPNDTKEDMGNKLAIKRLMKYKNDKIYGRLEDNKEYEEFINKQFDIVKEDSNNPFVKRKNEYLAMMLDISKTEKLNSNIDKVRLSNDLLEREGFSNKITYRLPDKEEEEEEQEQ